MNKTKSNKRRAASGGKTEKMVYDDGSAVKTVTHLQLKGEGADDKIRAFVRRARLADRNIGLYAFRKARFFVIDDEKNPEEIHLAAPSKWYPSLFAEVQNFTGGEYGRVTWKRSNPPTQVQLAKDAAKRNSVQSETKQQAQAPSAPIDANAWTQAMHQVQLEKEEQPPKGGMTVGEFAKKQNIHRATASTKLNVLVKKGLANRVSCHHLCGAAGIKIVPYFVLLEAKQASGQPRKPIRKEVV
jgi:hypothetical protein